MYTQNALTEAGSEETRGYSLALEESTASTAVSSDEEGNEMKKNLSIIIILCVLCANIVKASDSIDFDLGPIIDNAFEGATHAMHGNTYVVEIPILALNLNFNVETEDGSDITMDLLNSAPYSNFSEVVKVWDGLMDLIVETNLSFYEHMKDQGIENPAAVLMIEDNCGDDKYDDVYACIVNGDIISKIDDIRKIVYVVANKSNLKCIEETNAQNNTEIIEEYISQIEDLSSENKGLRSENESLKAENDELKSESRNSNEVDLNNMSTNELISLRDRINGLLDESIDGNATNYTIEQARIKYGYEIIKDTLLDPESMIVYDSYSWNSKSDKQWTAQMDANKGKSEEEKVELPDDLYVTYYNIGARNGFGGMAADEYIILYDLETGIIKGFDTRKNAVTAYEDHQTEKNQDYFEQGDNEVYRQFLNLDFWNIIGLPEEEGEDGFTDNEEFINSKDFEEINYKEILDLK